MAFPERELSSLQRAQEMARQALDDSPDAASQAGKHGRSADSPAPVSRTLAHLLDDLVGVPGTKIRFGVDPILSVVPFAGTAVGAVMGSVILFDAVRLRAPISVLTRMLGNYVIDWLLGLFPFIGALFDAAYRSNHKNYKLLERTIEDRGRAGRASAWYWLAVAVMVVVIIGVLLAVPIGLVLWLDAAVTGR